MHDIKISVAMATYNGEKYIYQQLESILNQSMAVDEIIVVDDNSSDKTIEIIEKLVNIRPHIFLASSNGHCAIATTLCIILDQTEFFENDELNLEKLFLTILNVIVECTLIRLFKQKLTVFDILRLQDIYKTTTEDILKVKLGKSIANYLVDNVEDLGMEYLISKNNIELN